MSAIVGYTTHPNTTENLAPYSQITYQGRDYSVVSNGNHTKIHWKFKCAHYQAAEKCKAGLWILKSDLTLYKSSVEKIKNRSYSNIRAS